MKIEFPDRGFLFDLHCIKRSICNRFDVPEARVEIVFFPDKCRNLAIPQVRPSVVGAFSELDPRFLAVL